MDNFSCQTDFSAKHDLTGMELAMRRIEKSYTIKELKTAFGIVTQQFFDGDDEKSDLPYILYWTAKPCISHC